MVEYASTVWDPNTWTAECRPAIPKIHYSIGPLNLTLNLYLTPVLLILKLIVLTIDLLTVTVNLTLTLTVGWIKMPLSTEVGLGPGDIVLDGDQAPPTERGQQPPLTTFPSFLSSLRLEVGPLKSS